MIKLEQNKLTRKEVKSLNFLDFSESGHFYMINKRIKDNPGLENRFNKMITGQLTDMEDLDHAMDLVDCYSEKFNQQLRLYIHINGFDMTKTIRNFISQHLDIIFKNQDFKKYIFASVNGSMCKKENNARTRLHWDIDNVTDIKYLYDKLKDLFDNTTSKHVKSFDELLIDYYPTKTGVHMILKGYNPTEIEPAALQIHKEINMSNNAFALVYYN